MEGKEDAVMRALSQALAGAQLNPRPPLDLVATHLSLALGPTAPLAPARTAPEGARPCIRACVHVCVAVDVTANSCMLLASSLSSC